MTPLQRSGIALLAALTVTGGVAGVVPDDAHPRPPLTCDEALEATDDRLSEFAVVCAYAQLLPPDSWPPGAQVPVDGHPEIQVIR